MKNFAIVANSAKGNSRQCADQVAAILEKNGCRCTASLIAEEDARYHYRFTDPSLVPKDTEAVLSLGGDGTFIHSCKDLISLQLPVFGVNYGTLGYMTEVGLDGFEDALKSMISGNYEIEERILLNCDIVFDGNVIKRSLAFNDIVLQRALDSGIAQYDVSVDGHYLNTYSADGMILSTPTGSTGYNLSAGGPVVLPISKIMLVTPICAHTLNSITIVLPSDVSIGIKGQANSRGKYPEIYVTIDGEKGIRLEEGASIHATGASETAKILKINKMSFIEQLGKKMR